MPTLGEELRRLREARGVSLTEISETTRIGTRFLKAIEGDNFSILPGGIFTRSFIRAYAKYVGMDEEEAVQRYQQQLTGSTPPQGVPASPSPRREAAPEPAAPSSSRTRTATTRAPAVPQLPRRTETIPSTNAPPGPTLSRVIIAVIILVFVSVAVFTLVRQLNAGGEKAAIPPATPATNSPQQGATPPSGASGPIAASQPTQPAAGEAARPGPSSDSGSRLVVRVEASSDSWIRYQVDDASPTQMILKPGQIEEIPAALNQIRLNFGNRQTLKLMINNRQAFFPPETPKFAAQVVISRDNLQSFFQ